MAQSDFKNLLDTEIQMGAESALVSFINPEFRKDDHAT